MSFYEIWQILILGFFPSIAPFLVLCGLVSIVATIFSGMSLRVTVPFVLAFGLLGGVTGFAVGESRVPVVGVVLPAMLTFSSAVLGYMFAKDTSRYRLVLPFCLVVLSLNSLLGLFTGSQMRAKHEEYERQYKEWMMHYEKVTLEVEKKEALTGLNYEEKDKPEDKGIDQPK